MIIALSSVIRQVFFETAFIDAFVFSILGDKRCFFLDLILLNLLGLFNFLVKIIDILDYGLIFHGLISISLISKELVLVQALILFSAVRSNRTSRNLLKLVPVEDNYVATSPAFFEVVEKRFSRVVLASFRPLFGLQKLFLASVTLALHFFHGLIYI